MSTVLLEREKGKKDSQHRKRVQDVIEIWALVISFPCVKQNKDKKDHPKDKVHR